MSFWDIFRSSLVGRKAPDISGDTWFNQTHLPQGALHPENGGQKVRIKDLKGKVVLIHFWDYSCVNCLNTLPYIKEWWRRYAEHDFIAIGVHTPEFEFAKDAAKVQSALMRFELNHPVVNDAGFATWERYKNKTRPRTLILDSKGVVRFDHAGDGSYQEQEKKIQDLIHGVHPDLVFDDPMTPINETDAPGAECKPSTPKIYVGLSRGEDAHDSIQAGSVYSLPVDLPLHRFALQGEWVLQSDEVISPAGSKDAANLLSLHYQGNELYVVMKPVGSESAVLEIQQNDMQLNAENMGEDAKIVDGKSMVTVDEDRMYKLVRNPAHGTYRVTLTIRSGRVSIHTISFGSSC